MTTELFFADATELAERIRTKDVSPVEVVQAHRDRIDSVNPVINAIVLPNDSALDQARAAERAVMNGDSLGPLHGVPFSVKEVFDTEGILSTRGPYCMPTESRRPTPMPFDGSRRQGQSS